MNIDEKDLIWLASYPKTGSTWLKEIINEIISPTEKAKDSIPSFQKVFPELPPQHDFQNQKISIIKTHFHPENKRISSFISRTKGVILIYRHPLDILLSSLNYAKVKGRGDYFRNEVIKSVEQIIKDNEFNYYLNQFVESDGMPYFRGSSGEWSKYVNRWSQFAKKQSIKICTLKYENMVENPKIAIEKLCGFFGHKRSTKEIINIIQNCEVKTQKNGKFFWKKKAYNYKSMLNKDQINLFEKNFNQPLVEQGYL